MQNIENPEYRSYLKELVNLSISGLNDLYIGERLEFSERKIFNDNFVKIAGANRRYTLINLIGLHKAESHDFNISVTEKIDLKTILNNQIKNLSDYESVGDIGLLLWATSLISPDEIPIILAKINFGNILSTYKDAKLRNTMELSWLLIGILMASTFSETFKNLVGNLRSELYKIIRNNYGGRGVFRHRSGKSFSCKFRSNMGNFRDQVYPIYAFVLYSQQMKNEEALLIAEETALTICEHQGENGEWMWLYNAKTGQVLSKYPIYTVHQDAMAPMALYAIQKATGINFEKYIFDGLNWLKKTSFNSEILSRNHNAIWQEVGPNKIVRKIKSTLLYLGLNSVDEYKNMKVVKECRSYYLGWLLFALAGRLNQANDVYNQNNNEFKVFNLSDYHF